jgi:hypothetical protein
LRTAATRAAPHAASVTAGEMTESAAAARWLRGGVGVSRVGDDSGASGGS